MRRFFSMLWLGLLVSVAGSLGCTMCNTGHMHDYSAAGGKWQRGNPTCGRVGSTLSDAGAMHSETSVGFGQNYGDSWNLMEGEPTPVEAQPTPADEGQSASALNSEFFGTQFIDSSSSEHAEPEAGSIMIGP